MRDAIRIHIKTLANESRVIRREEIKDKHQAARIRRKFGNAETRAEKYRNEKYLHRIRVVRPEARAAHLAYGFLKGIPYSVMEYWSEEFPNWARVEDLVLRHGEEDPRQLKQRFAQWKDEALKRKTTSGRTFNPAPVNRKTPVPREGVFGFVREFLGGLFA